MNVVFDFGAVLFTWRPAEIVAEVFPDHAPDKTKAQALAQELFGYADWHDFDRGLLLAEEVVARSALRLKLHHDTLHRLVAGIGDRLVPMQNTIAVLQQLHAKREAGQGVSGLYYLSNMPKPYARELEQKHAFLNLFDGGIFRVTSNSANPTCAPISTCRRATGWSLHTHCLLMICRATLRLQTSRAGRAFNSLPQNN